MTKTDLNCHYGNLADEVVSAKPKNKNSFDIFFSGIIIGLLIAEIQWYLIIEYLF